MTKSLTELEAHERSTWMRYFVASQGIAPLFNDWAEASNELHEARMAHDDMMAMAQEEADALESARTNSKDK